MKLIEEIIIATENKGKAAEFSYLLGSYFSRVRCLLDFDQIPEIVEDGSSFEENAVKKAQITSEFFNKMVIADDSGLAVTSLNGEPGIYSARYAGENSTDDQNVNKLLEKIRSVKNREARFICAVVLACPDGMTRLFKGTCNGVIIDEKRGNNGFGYDPVFYLPEMKMTMAELDPADKNKISHRAKAVKKLVDYLNSFLGVERT